MTPSLGSPALVVLMNIFQKIIFQTAFLPPDPTPQIRQMGSKAEVKIQVSDFVVRLKPVDQRLKRKMRSKSRSHQIQIPGPYSQTWSSPHGQVCSQEYKNKIKEIFCKRILVRWKESIARNPIVPFQEFLWQPFRATNFTDSYLCHQLTMLSSHSLILSRHLSLGFPSERSLACFAS